MNDEVAVLWVPEVEVVFVVPYNAIFYHGCRETDVDAVIVTGE